MDFCISLQWNNNLVIVRTEQQCENYHTDPWEDVWGGCCDVPEKFFDHGNDLNLFPGR